MLQFVKWLLSLFSQSKIHKTLIFKKRKKNLPEKIFKKLNKIEILPENSVFTKILTPKWVDLRTIVASQSLLMFPTLDKTKLKTDNSVAKKRVFVLFFEHEKKPRLKKRIPPDYSVHSVHYCDEEDHRFSFCSLSRRVFLSSFFPARFSPEDRPNCAVIRFSLDGPSMERLRLHSKLPGRFFGKLKYFTFWNKFDRTNK